MKQSCNVIKDLLILYEDDACSEESIQLIEEHLKTCPECSKYLERIQHTDDILSEEIKETILPEEKIMKHSLKKVRRRWVASLIAVFMLIPLLGVGIMGYHEAQDDGVAFSNLDDIYRCIQYLECIEDREFEKAAELIDFSKNSYTLVESVAHMTVEEYQAYMKERFIQKLQEYDTLGIYIDNISYDSAYRANGDRWTICVSFDENYPDGSEQKIIVHMNGETMYAGAYSYPYKGRVNRDDYINEILNLYSEDDALDYQEMEVSFVLEEGEKAIITLKNETDFSDYSVGLFDISYGTATSLMREPFGQNSFETSVPGTYSICAIKGQGEVLYLTVEDVKIQIVEY